MLLVRHEAKNEGVLLVILGADKLDQLVEDHVQDSWQLLSTVTNSRGGSAVQECGE